MHRTLQRARCAWQAVAAAAPTPFSGHVSGRVLPSVSARCLCVSTPAGDGGLVWTPVDRPIRNVAVIAHVDHGKTTMVDRLMQAGGEGDRVTGDRVMDSNDLERERGITILSKVTAINHASTTIQLVDTPGHADFSGEVQRICSMVDGALLLVDAREGVCPQTRFVLSEALSRGLTPMVVFNKCDREDSRVGGPVEDEVLDLLFALGANDEQLEYPTLYASAKDGWATANVDHVFDPVARAAAGVTPILDTIVSTVPPPGVCGGPEDPLRFLVTQMAGDTFLGRMVTGKVSSGSVRVGDALHTLTRTGEVAFPDGRVTKVMAPRGVGRVEVEVGLPGDIVTLAGVGDGTPSMTVPSKSVTAPLPADPIDPPTLGVVVGVNDSPLAGKAGKFMTSAQIQKRLQREAESNVAISVEAAPTSSGKSEAVEVRGRGELQLAVILETMRREGYEMSVSPPRVVFQTAEDGTVEEPYEEVTMDVSEEHAGVQVEKMQLRGADMSDYDTGDDGRVKLVFTAPSRCLLGLQSEFRTDTRGGGVLHRGFHGYGPKVASAAPRSAKGALISNSPGTVAAYALRDLEARGVLFVRPGDAVYTGQVIGEHVRSADLDVNPVRAKKLTNIRAAGSDESIRLAPPREFTLEEAITSLREDELLEVTPEVFRVRKAALDPAARKVASRKAGKK